jgi:NDP-sugar pyrophosphorylase family protein
MIGKAVSLKGLKYNVIILAGGLGSRMGISSEFIPKALTKIGSGRAIDFLIERYSDVAAKFIIGVGHQGDLLESYIRGRYSGTIDFSREAATEIINNSFSTMYCLDHADSRIGTIISFCDLIMMDNLVLANDMLYYVDEQTEGAPGTFRHSIQFTNNSQFSIIQNQRPTFRSNGVLGTFIFGNTPLLKSIIYSKYPSLNDLTDDLVSEYHNCIPLRAVACKNVFEFGTAEDLNKVRELWYES